MSFAVGKRMMAKFQSWVEPSDNVSIPAERRRARLLSGLLIFTVAMVFLSVFSSRTVVALITLVFIVGAYVLSRTRYYQWGALLAVITLMLPSFVAVFTLPSAQLADPASIVIPLSWLLVALIFSSLWLQVWLTTLLIGTTQETVFDEFRQAENGIERGGTGLGLAIVRKLVLMMGGNIRLSSELGHGSTFIVTLPLITEVQPASEVIEI